MAKLMTSKKYATPFSMLHAASLLSHRSRLAKFDEAIKRVVCPESCVLDIGTGTGVLAMFAARAGARRVIALDINEESICYARQAVENNGFGDRIELIAGHFEEFVPDEPVDVVICEMLSSMMLVEQQVPASKYIVNHILQGHGVLLPQSATVYVVPVECPSVWQRFNVAGLEFPPVPQTVSPCERRDLADAAIVAEHKFTDPHTSLIVERQLFFTAVDTGIVHGLVGFFESHLLDNIHLTMDDGWRELFLPLTQPIRVTPGDEFTVYLRYEPGKFDSLQLNII